jgi:hypothetical protein
MATTIPSTIHHRRLKETDLEGSSVMMDEPTANSSSPSLTGSASLPHRDTMNNALVYETSLHPERQAYFPSTESFASSVWSSTDGQSESSSGDSDSDCFSDYSTESSGGSFDEQELQEMLNSPRGRRPLVLPPRPRVAAGSATVAAVTKPPIPPPPLSEGLPFGGAEGLPFTLESLKRDLEKVGRAIITSNAGEVAAERAQTLASINWLASHVPNAVLDKLGREVRDNLGQHDEDEDDSQNDDKSTIGVNKVTDIISDDTMSEVSELSNHDDDPSYGEDETMKLVEPADVSNVQISYGDLATFAHTRASSFLPEDETLTQMANRRFTMGPSMLPEIDEINPSGTPQLSTGSTGGILDSLPMKNDTCPSRKPASSSSILDMIPSKREGLVSLAPGLSSKCSMSTVTTASSTAGTKNSQKKGVKGLLRRFKRGKGDAESMLPLTSPPISPLDVARPKLPNTPDSVGWYTLKATTSEAKSKPVSRPTRAPRVAADEKKKLPYATKYRCALLFVDISGFTKLSRLLDPESLSRVSFRIVF